MLGQESTAPATPPAAAVSRPPASPSGRDGRRRGGRPAGPKQQQRARTPSPEPCKDTLPQESAEPLHVAEHQWRNQVRRRGHDDARFREQFRKTELCKFFELGKCKRGRECKFAHGEEELMPPPSLTKTALCPAWQLNRCPHAAADCAFAHGCHELRRNEVYLQFPKPRPCKVAAPKAQPSRQSAFAPGPASPTAQAGMVLRLHVILGISSTTPAVQALGQPPLQGDLAAGEAPAAPAGGETGGDDGAGPRPFPLVVAGAATGQPNPGLLLIQFARANEMEEWLVRNQPDHYED